MTPYEQTEYIIKGEHLIQFRRGTITFEDIEAYAHSHIHTKGLPTPELQNPCYSECDDCQRHECNIARECLASNPAKVERKESYNRSNNLKWGLLRNDQE